MILHVQIKLIENKIGFSCKYLLMNRNPFYQLILTAAHVSHRRVERPTCNAVGQQIFSRKLQQKD